MKERLLAKLQELIQKFRIAEDNFWKTDSLEQFEYGVEKDAINDTIKKLQLNFAMAFPEEEKEKIHGILEDIQKKKLNDDKKFEAYKIAGKNHIDVKTAYMKKFYMFFNFPNTLIDNGGLQEFFEQTAEMLDEETLGKVIDDIENYKSPYYHNVEVYLWRERIDDLKKKNEERVKDADKLKELNDELESIANLVVTSDRDYSKTYGDERDKVITRIGNDRMETSNAESLSSGKYERLNKYFSTSNTKNDGTRAIHDLRGGDPNLAKDFNLDDVKMKIPEDRQNAIREVFRYMRDRGMFVDNANTNEAGKKIYGFVKLFDAHNQLSEAIEGTDIEAIRAAKAEYNRQLENMRGLYALIKEKFNTNEDMMISNITSYREGWIPNEFKNKEDLVNNVYVNALFALNATLQTNNISLDQLFEDPGKVFYDVIKDIAKNLMPNNHLNHESVSEAISQLAVGKSTGFFPQHGLPRNLEFLLSLSVNRPEYKQNAFATMLFQTYSIYVTEISYRYTFSKVENYLDKNAAETIANILLVNPEDRDYNKLKAFDDLTYDATEKIPAFDTLEYLIAHDVPANQLVTRIKDTISELTGKEIKSSINMTKNDMLLRSVEAAQMAAIQYLVVHPTPEEGVMTKSEYNELKQIAEKPEVAFAKTLKKIYVEEKPEPSKKPKLGEKPEPDEKPVKPKKKPLLTLIAESRTYQKFTENSKKELDIARRNAKNAENLYNARMDSIKKRISELNGQLFGLNDDAKVNEITKELMTLESEMKILPNIEIARLEREYMKGNLPKDYFDQRRSNVANNSKENHYNDFVPFGVDEYPSFNTFKEKYAQDIALGNLNKDDVKYMYDRMIGNARFEEKRFGLMHAANHPKPTLTDKSDLNTWFIETREAVRESELVYRKNLAEIELLIGNVKGDIKTAKARETDTTELQAKLNVKLDELNRKVNELISEEVKRLDKEYTDGKLPRDYYEQRKQNIQNGKADDKVPFGTDEYPTFDEFKEKYSDDLKEDNITEEDVQFFYSRMIENARMTETDFFLTASGVKSAPTLDAPEEFRYQIEIPELSDFDNSQKSPEIKQHDNPTVNKGIYP